jgi:gamma-glutamylcyclotransferase (GGCT)/AIG2-like uncharacterized protein YtfP
MVQDRNLIAVYGSLKKGFYNHGRCGEQVPAGEMTIKGKMTLVANAYPKLFLTDEGDEHEVELYMVDAITFTMLNQMELGAGYTPIHISSPAGDATMWVIDSEERLTGVPIKEYSHDLFERVIE